MVDAKQTRVPAGRVERLLKLGGLATGVAASAAMHGAAQVARGRKPSASASLLSPANARRVAGQLAQMRGAVMKVGQLLSMEAGDILPPELTEILSGLRDGAHAMPDKQLEQVLERSWGADWTARFESFERKPFAAASIGQVHAAVDRAGRRLAIKVQYPGVAASIDSDVDNVAALLKLLRLLPPGFEIEPLLAIARRQLHDESDYRLEATYLRRYADRLGAHPVFRVPAVVDELSSREVLAMNLVDGQGIESLAREEPALRNRLAGEIIDLTLREFLHWGMVQSDPNFANFLFDREQGTIGLLDFGALRINHPRRADTLAGLLRATLTQDVAQVVAAATGVGYLDRADPFNLRLAVADLLLTAAEPLHAEGAYDFATAQLSARLADKLLYLRNQAQFTRVPPADVLFLHRKLAGIYLLCARINARVDVRARVEAVLSEGVARASRRAAV